MINPKTTQTMKNLEIGMIVFADVAYKYVPFIRTKVQQVTINHIEQDCNGNTLYGGLTEKGKQVNFTDYEN